MRAALATALLSVVLAASGALAQDADPDAPCVVTTDVNLEDAPVGPRDFDTVMGALFMAWDANGDGALTPSEYDACASRLDLPPSFVALDHDADGTIVREEWTSEENFAAMDLNNDETLAPGEFLFDDALTGNHSGKPG